MNNLLKYFKTNKKSTIMVYDIAEKSPCVINSCSLEKANRISKYYKNLIGTFLFSVVSIIVISLIFI